MRLMPFVLIAMNIVLLVLILNCFSAILVSVDSSCSCLSAEILVQKDIMLKILIRPVFNVKNLVLLA